MNEAADSVQPHPSPRRVVVGLALVHVVLWTLVPSAVNRNLPLDTIEALAWGHEWQWGYDKHPPLSAWVAEMVAMLTFRSDWGQYLLSQWCVAMTLFTVYGLARDVLSAAAEDTKAQGTIDAAAMVATLVLEGIFFFNYTSPEFNVNVIQLPIWAMAIACYWRATKTGSLASWVGLGVFAGWAALAKYLALVMLVPMAVYAVWSPRRRNIFLSPGPYIAAAVFALVLLLHVMWMIEHDFQTLHYGLRRASAAQTSALDHLTHPLRFVASQAAIAGGAIVLFLFAKPTQRRRSDEASYSEARSPGARDARIFALLMAVGPVLTLALLSLCMGVRLRTMWATPMLSMSGVALAAWFPISASPVELRRFTRVVLAVLCAAVIAYGGVALWGDRATSEHRTHFPGPSLAETITRQWHDRYASPLPIVIGDEWYAGSVAWYSPDRPQVYLDGDPKRSPWLDDETVRQRGAVIVWIAVDQDDKRYPLSEALPGGLDKRFKIADTLVLDVQWRPRKGSRNIVLHAAFVAPK